MKWIVAAPFIKSHGDRWLSASVPGDNHIFSSVGAHYSLSGMAPKTGFLNWIDYFKHAWRALRIAHAESSGIITYFPQLAVACGLLSRVFYPRIPIIAWTFNVGELPKGPKRYFGKIALSRIEAMIVHSTAEIEQCADCFSVPRQKVVFVPLQCATAASPDVRENEDDPYLLAMGSANRDYHLLFEVLRLRPLRTIVVASPHAIENLVIPACVEFRSGLSREECHRILQGARVSIIPVANAKTASGQVTLLDSMAMRRATIVTRCPGSVDYILDGDTGILVAPGDPDDLMRAIERLWTDDTYRAKLGNRGFEHLQKNFSDDAIGKVMGSICDAIEESRPIHTRAHDSANCDENEVFHR